MLYFILLIICVIFPDLTLNAAKESISLWATSVLPSLFPFFIISKAIYYNGGIEIFSTVLRPITTILGIPKNAAFPFAMSIMCGYPTGSRTVAQMNLTKSKDFFANICYSSSPLFIIGTVGTVILNNTESGYILYIIHICTLLIFTAIYSPKQEKEDFIISYEKGSLGNAIADSIFAVLNICGFMVFFNILTKILTFGFIPDEINILLSGIIEFTNGINSASKSFVEPLPIISFFLSFGGICVISQCVCVLKDINITEFIRNRIFCGSIAFVLCVIYKKTALYMPIAITVLVIISAYILRRKSFYLLKSARS